MEFDDYITVSGVDAGLGSMVATTTTTKAYLVSFYEKQYQRNTGNEKNIMAVLSMPYSVVRGDSRLKNIH